MGRCSRGFQNFPRAWLCLGFPSGDASCAPIGRSHQPFSLGRPVSGVRPSVFRRPHGGSGPASGPPGTRGTRLLLGSVGGSRSQGGPTPASGVHCGSRARSVQRVHTSGTSVVLWWLACVCVWSSLRFGDAQRCCPDSITLEEGILRGNCWRTKTSRSGQPWGCLASGASGGTPCWGERWFSALRAFASSFSPGETLDFLIPEILPGLEPGTSIVLRRPMPYSSALASLRAALQSPDLLSGHASSKQLSRSYTLHGCKVTLLSWSRQLGVPEELRREQGHHRVGGGPASVRLYSRDDVWGPLRLQQHIVVSLRSGWRPLTP